MNYCGIDLHSNNRVVIVSDDSDRIVYQKRLPNELAQLVAALEPYRHELTGVVVESTYNWYWLVDRLMDSGYRVHLAHPAAIRKYDGLKHSGDFAGAAYLTKLLRLGLLPKGYVYPRENRVAPTHAPRAAPEPARIGPAAIFERGFDTVQKHSDHAPHGGSVALRH